MSLQCLYRGAALHQLLLTDSGNKCKMGVGGGGEAHSLLLWGMYPTSYSTSNIKKELIKQFLKIRLFVA